MSRSLPDPSKAPQIYEAKPRDPAHAIQWTGKNWAEVSQWVYGELKDVENLSESDPDLWDSLPVTIDGQYLSLLNSHGNPYVDPFGWLLFRDGEWLAMDEDEFEFVYEV